MSGKQKKLLWVDLEMTGLDEKVHHIVEVAAVITDMNFEVLGQMHRVVYQPPEVLSGMDEFVRNLHTKSKLVEQIPAGLPLSQVDRELLDLIEKHFTPDEKVILAGNSVSNDKRFIDFGMPATAGRLHYRIVDVSSFKEIFVEKYHLHFDKKNAHRATDDILESIEELKYYLAYVEREKS